MTQKFNSEQDKMKLDESQMEFIFEKFKAHYKFSHYLKFGGRKSCCNSNRVQIWRSQMTLYTLIHEVAHAIQFKKRKTVDSEGNRIRTKFHTKKHTKLMERLYRYFNSHWSQWQETMQKDIERNKVRLEKQSAKINQIMAYKGSPQYKLDLIEKNIKNWESKMRRAQNALKKLNRRKKLWENRFETKKLPNGLVVKVIKAPVPTVKQNALKLIQEKGCTFSQDIYNIEVFAHEGWVFDGELHSLICTDWKDVIGRLSSCSIEKEAQEVEPIQVTT
jgi:hypothetical protein